jgi:predicted RNase H-like HicB family nuclease
MDLNFEKERLSCSVSIILEKSGKKTNYISRCEELGISDFGDSLEESLDNLKKALRLLIKNAPEKKQLLKKNNPLLTTRIFLL